MSKHNITSNDNSNDDCGEEMTQAQKRPKLSEDSSDTSSLALQNEMDSLLRHIDTLQEEHDVERHKTDEMLQSCKHQIRIEQQRGDRYKSKGLELKDTIQSLRNKLCNMERQSQVEKLRSSISLKHTTEILDTKSAELAQAKREMEHVGMSLDFYKEWRVRDIEEGCQYLWTTFIDGGKYI
jgi:hypothetical protein